MCNLSYKWSHTERSTLCPNKATCTMSTVCHVLPWWVAGVAVAVAADSSGFVDVGAECARNHFPISLPPAAKPGVLFSWQQYNRTVTKVSNDRAKLMIAVTSSGPDLLRKVWNSGTTSSEPTHREWCPPADSWSPGKIEATSGWCTYTTWWLWSHPEDWPEGQEQKF